MKTDEDDYDGETLSNHQEQQIAKLKAEMNFYVQMKIAKKKLEKKKKN